MGSGTVICRCCMRWRRRSAPASGPRALRWTPGTLPATSKSARTARAFRNRPFWRFAASARHQGLPPCDRGEPGRSGPDHRPRPSERDRRQRGADAGADRTGAQGKGQGRRMNHPMGHPMNHPMRHPVTVLVAPRSHPVSQRPTRCPADARAVTLALGLSLPVRLLTAGAMPEQVARDYLALGAGQIDILPCADDSLLLPALLPALRAADWVLTGTRSAVDHGSGVLPHALAAALQQPLVARG